MKKTYHGYYNCNGTRNRAGYTYTSLREAKKSIRTICKGNTHAGNAGHWRIDDDDNNTIAQGEIRNRQG